MVRWLVRFAGSVVLVAGVLAVPAVLSTTAPASADTVINGCTIVSNPTTTSFTNCPGANLAGANLAGVNLSFANLAGALFTDSGLSCSNTSCDAADLSGANLTDANLSDTSYFDSGIYAPCGVPSCLQEVSGAVNLSGANLTGAVLTGANLTGTPLVPSNQSAYAPTTGAVITWATPQSLPGATPGTCTAASGSNFPLGTTTVTCQVLDDHGDAATGTFTVEVSQAPTFADLTSSVSGPVGVGAQVTYTADLGLGPPPIPNPPPLSGGTVAFTEDGSTIAGCSAVPVVTGNPAEASCSVTFATAGSHAIQPIYSGSGVFQGVNGQILTQNVVSTPAPTTRVLVPSNGATVSNNTWLDAGASSAVGIASVSFELNGFAVSNTVIARATPTLYGWLGAWNSTSLPNGTYALQSVATDKDGTSSTSVPITVTVNNTPSTSVLIPSAGATQSGTAALLDAAASADVTDVSYELSGGTLSNKVIAAATSTLYGWLAHWNTTSVPNGTYTLQSVATYSNPYPPYSGSITSAPVTITVDNAPPTTTVVLPSNNASVMGNQYLDATASPGVTQTTYELSGGPANMSDDVIATGTPTLYGWIGQWNTTAVPNGTYTLQSVASYTGGVSGTSTPITITVNNPLSTSVIVPASGATIDTAKGLVLDAVASAGATAVSIAVSANGQTITYTTTSTLYGWIAVVPAFECAPTPCLSVPLPDSIVSVATFAGGVSVTSPPLTGTLIAYCSASICL
jgi:hypothetical protein